MRKAHRFKGNFGVIYVCKIFDISLAFVAYGLTTFAAGVDVFSRMSEALD